MNRTSHPATKFGRNISGYVHDMLTLIELQLRLFAVDLRDGSKAAGVGFGAVAAGILAALGAIPLVLVTLAMALIEFAGCSYTLSFGVSALLGLIAELAPPTSAGSDCFQPGRPSAVRRRRRSKH